MNDTKEISSRTNERAYQTNFSTNELSTSTYINFYAEPMEDTKEILHERERAFYVNFLTKFLRRTDGRYQSNFSTNERTKQVTFKFNFKHLNFSKDIDNSPIYCLGGFHQGFLWSSKPCVAVGELIKKRKFGYILLFPF